jgi:hypothetical protein
MDDVKRRKTPDVPERASDQESLANAPGAHPVGTGVGVLSGAAAGAAIGMAGGPIGAAVGGVIGAAAGGLAGKGVAELVNPIAEEEHWRDAYVREPYFQPGTTYDYYATGYRTGWEGRARYEGRTFNDVESQLRAEYDRARTEDTPEWREGRLAAKAAWDRIDDLMINAR